MAASIRSFNGGPGCEIVGLDLTDLVSAADFAVVERALLDHLVFVIRAPDLEISHLLELSRRFGGLEPHILDQYHHESTPEVSVISNVVESGKGRETARPAGAYWHSDLSYKAVPSDATLLYAVEVPAAGGDTLFTDMYRAYETLDAADRQRLDGLAARHRYGGKRWHDAKVGLTPAQQARVPEVVHPVVRTHPVTNRKALFVNPGFTTGIVGLDEPESDALLERLYAHATRPEFQYRHRWQRGDIVACDNRATMHCATGGYSKADRRTLFRMIVGGKAAA